MRKKWIKLVCLLSVALTVALLVPQRAAADDDDPPSRVARLSYTHGNVSFNPGGTDDWVSAVVNRPLTTGDKLWSDSDARAELHLGSAAIRLSGNTGFSFLNLTDLMAQVRLTEGTLNIRVRRLGDDETFEVDTPNLAFSILRPGNYRINVNEAGDTTVVVVRDGQGEVTGGGSAYTIHPREAGTFAGTDQLDADIQSYGGDDDDFDHWCSDRDRREDHSTSARYVSDDVIGYEDLDDNGGWRPVPEYGTVWFPHTVVVGWAPYRYGHWAWIAPWGWTWVDDAAWGFAPFHYGRWVVVGGVWGWVPCPPRPVVVGVAYVRPVYAPALVAWVGGAHWGVGVAVGGGGGGVAWFPLGPRDVYCPSYHVSERYVQNVNVSNTVIINKTQVTNVYNNVYVNKTTNVTNITYQNQTAPNAVTATSHQAFTSAQPVHNNMIRVDAKEVASAPAAPMTPTVAPQQRSVLGSGAQAHALPPAALANRAVVAKQAPPPPPAPFVKQQQLIQANGGRPPAISRLRQVQPESAQVAHPNVKIAPPTQQAPAQNAQGNRQGPPQGNPNRPSSVNNTNQAATTPVNPNQPSTANTAPQPGPAVKPGNANANPGNPKAYNDRPPTVRPSNSNNSSNVNPQLEQKHRQELQGLRTKQDQERQKVEQQQVQQRQKLEQDNARRQQVDQRPPQADQRLPQADQRPPQADQRPPQADQRPPRVDQRPPQADQKPPQQVDRKQQQLEQKQQQQLQQLEQKHDQQQQKLQQKQQQEHQRQDKPPKQDKPAKQDKPDKPRG
jgi:hypothetical protein